jgi:RNA polymerase sigma-70 factor (ECF subfamily)
MTAALTGDAAAYRSLLGETARLLRGYYARRLGAGAADIEDLVQETLIAMHSRRSTYDITQPLTPWLHAIARYKLIDHLRRTKRRHVVPLDEAKDMFDPSDHEAATAKRDVEKLVSRLPERAQGLVRDVKIEGKSIEDAGAARGMSDSAVKVAVHRALRSLSAMLKGGAG